MKTNELETGKLPFLFLRFVLDLSSSMPPTSHEACLSMTEQKY